MPGSAAGGEATLVGCRLAAAGMPQTPRRTVLRAAVALASGAITACVPVPGGGTVDPAELYVGLGRARAVAVLDAAADVERRRIALDPLGYRGLPWRIGVGPAGGAAVVPLVSRGPQVGHVAPSQRGAPTQVGRGATIRCGVLGVGTGRQGQSPAGEREISQGLAADDRGRAYILLGDGWGGEPSLAAVVDLAQGTVLRHLPLAPAGATVFALAAAPDGSRLYAAIWQWNDAAGPNSYTGQPGAGRLIAIDTATGRVLARAPLPPDMAVTDIALASPPPGTSVSTGTCVYVVTTQPGPTRDDDDWWAPGAQFALAALDSRSLDILVALPLARRPDALGVAPNGTEAYLLASGSSRGSTLTRLDLTSGAVNRQWPLPGWGLALAVGPGGKAYVADPLGDRLWRVDMRTGTLLGDLSMPGAPITVAWRALVA